MDVVDEEKVYAMRLLPPFAQLGEATPMTPPSDQHVIDPDATSLDFLQAIYRDSSLPLAVRQRAAIAALPFEHPKLAVVATIPGANLAAQLQAAMVRSGRTIVLDAKPRATPEGD